MKNLKLTEEDCGKTYSIQLGNEFSIELKYRMGGYFWHVESPDLLKGKISRQTIPGNRRKNGAGGKNKFIFRPSEVGSQTLKFVYKRIFEIKNKPKKICSITIIVK